ncbi:hypothetical protein AHAS_Ahas13G0154500 [Arachis hypogaea]
MESRKRKQILEDSSLESKSESNDETEIGTETIEEFLRQSKKKKTNEEAPAQGMPEVNLANETDPLFQGQMDQSSINKPRIALDFRLSREKESVSDPAQQQMVFFQPPSEPLNIVPIQLCLPSSQIISASPVPPLEPSPPPTESTPQPQKVDESTPTVPPVPFKIDPALEVTATALLMMARTASYIPREFSLPSFSLYLTNSSQKKHKAKREGKSPPIEKQTVGQIFDKFETPARSNLMSAEMKEKFYLWATLIRTYGDGSTNEYDPICTLNAQQLLVLSRVHFASLKATSYIETDIVTVMCLILNQENIKRFQEEIYCLPSNIVNMAIGNHQGGEFL